MTELRFHRELYRGTSVDEAIKVFKKYGAFEQAEEASHWIVKITAKTEARERELAGELSNYALGLTVKSGGVT